MAENRPPPDALGPTRPLAPPLYQSTVYSLPDLDALDRVSDGLEPGFTYLRDAHPNARRLADRLAALEGGDWAVVCATGMAALSAILLSAVERGGRVVASNRLYGRTTQLLGQELARFGVETAFVDTDDLDAVRRALQAPARLLLVETLSNPMLRVADLPALAGLARERGCPLAVDNTFATPVLARPLELGAELVMESLTKMIGGHSDVMLGLVSGRGDRLKEMARVVSVWGLSSNPFDCWLTERGLATLGLRVRAACANAAALADWLAGRPGVTRVIYPGRPDHPDHALARRLFGGLNGNMLCFELAGGREAVNRFLRRAPGVPLSPSLGDTATTCSHPDTTSHRYVAPEEKARQGITEGLVRLSVGVEELGAIQAEMAKGLA
jgi:cystathionine beta-lyase/cystathionine gamma-synthase